MNNNKITNEEIINDVNTEKLPTNLIFLNKVDEFLSEMIEYHNNYLEFMDSDKFKFIKTLKAIDNKLNRVKEQFDIYM